MERDFYQRLRLCGTSRFAVAFLAIASACTGPEQPTTAPPYASSTLAVVQDTCDPCVFAQTFTRNRGTPVTESLMIAGNAATDYVIDVTDHGDRGANAEVRLNGKVIVESSQVADDSVYHLYRSIALSTSNTLAVRLTGKPESRLTIRILAGTKVIGEGGGSLQLSGVASLALPPRFLSEPTSVEITQSSDPSAATRFADLEGLFQVLTKETQLVRVLVGPRYPAAETFSATFTVSPSFVVPASARPELFAQVYETGGQETLDNFQLLVSSWEPATGKISAEVPSFVFTDTRRSDGMFEALFMIATTPGTGLSSPAVSWRTAPPLSGIATATTCQAASIGSPVPAGTAVTSPYDLSRVNPLPPPTIQPHWGTDFGVNSGISITAASDGAIEQINTQVDAHGNPTGYGLYLILRHRDGSATLYAHLRQTLSPVHQRVIRGDPIALSDNSGSSTGPHLHLEYVPNGAIVQSKGRIDPYPCISAVPTVLRQFDNLCLDTTTIPSSPIAVCGSIRLQTVNSSTGGTDVTVWMRGEQGSLGLNDANTGSAVNDVLIGAPNWGSIVGSPVISSEGNVALHGTRSLATVFQIQPNGAHFEITNRFGSSMRGGAVGCLVTSIVASYSVPYLLVQHCDPQALSGWIRFDFKTSGVWNANQLQALRIGLQFVVFPIVGGGGSCNAPAFSSGPGTCLVVTVP